MVNCVDSGSMDRIGAKVNPPNHHLCLWVRLEGLIEFSTTLWKTIESFPQVLLYLWKTIYLPLNIISIKLKFLLFLWRSCLVLHFHAILVLYILLIKFIEVVIEFFEVVSLCFSH